MERLRALSCECALRPLAPEHHDRMLMLEADPFDTLVELVEIAATWEEVEYDENNAVLAPCHWLDFADQHSWNDPNRVYELMLALVSAARPRLPSSGVLAINDSSIPSLRLVEGEGSAGSTARADERAALELTSGA